ncbi:MAG: uracil-DNA glycosylase, partial [Alphaproteobacteria bacterium]|nr:uracil-DNA glycosylase [Alphaproteobacteria bacterium]
MDAAIGEAANDFLSAPEPAAVPRSPAEPRPAVDRVPSRAADAPPRPVAAPPPAADAAVMAAREAARSAATLDELRAILDRFDGCGLKGSASRLCFADG